MSGLNVVVIEDSARLGRGRVVVRMNGVNMLTVSKDIPLSEAAETGVCLSYILNVARALGLAEGVRRVAGEQAGQAALDDAMNAADAMFAAASTPQGKSS